MEVYNVIEEDDGGMRVEVDLNQDEMNTFANIAIRDLVENSKGALVIQDEIEVDKVTLSIESTLFHSLMEISFNKILLESIKYQENSA